jgi:hypothetical protein
LALLLTIHVNVNAYDLAESASVALTVGLTGLARAYVVLIMTATGALSGYLIGTFWPAPTRYALFDFARLAHFFGAAAAPTPAQPAFALASDVDTPLTTAAMPIAAREPAAPLVPRPAPAAPAPQAQPETLAASKSPPAAAVHAAPAVASTVSAVSDPVEQLRKLAELRDAGVVTPDEFEDAKRKILGAL